MSKLSKGFAYAFTGIQIAWKEEMNFRIEIACAVLAIALGIVLHLSPIEFALVISAITCVLTAEAFNTALEQLCDKFQPTHGPHIAKIKDLAAAAVLLAAIGSAIVGIAIYIPHL